MTKGRFGPLQPDDPIVGRACCVCGTQMAAGQAPALVDKGPADKAEAERAASGAAYTAVADIAHEACVWPDKEDAP